MNLSEKQRVSPEHIKAKRLSYKFLLRILPVILGSSVLYFAALVRFEQQQIVATNKALSHDWAKNDTALITESLWHLDEDGVRRVLEAQAKRTQVDCIHLYQFSSVMPSDMRAGACQNAPALYEIQTPVTSHAKGEEVLIGQLVHAITVEPSLRELFAQLKPLLLMLALLTSLLVISVIFVFRSLILLPLSKVSHSIARFRLDGIRELAEWHSNDELGLLIKEYNQGLLQQDRSEAELKNSIAQTQQALSDLQQAQKSLLEAEKLASLGSLVAGIAHEINTPVGNSLTVASAISAKIEVFKQEVESGQLRKSALAVFLQNMDEASQILQRSLNAAALQIQNFKQVAVDQTSSQRRRFDLKDTLDELLSTLRPALKTKSFALESDIPADIVLDSYPGPLGQAVTNAFNNALLHAFDGRDSGVIRIEARLLDQDQVELALSDNGCGMNEEQLRRVFEPFFTTRMGRGGSGLGMNLVYNIVTGILGGSIHFESELDSGTQVVMRIPLIAPNTSSTQE